MIRRRAKTDANHREMVGALRALGADVLDLSGVGGGCPDLLVHHAGRHVLAEIKRDARAARARTPVTERQRAFREAWRGPVAVLITLDDAEALVAEMRASPITPEAA